MAPSLSESIASPCQWTISLLAVAFVTSMETGTPWRNRSSGPGTCPLYATVLIETPGPMSSVHGSMRRLKSGFPAGLPSAANMRGISACSELPATRLPVAERKFLRFMKIFATSGMSPFHHISGAGTLPSPTCSCSIIYKVCAVTPTTLPRASPSE